MILNEAIKKSSEGIAVRNKDKVFHFIHRDGKSYQICQGQINTKTDLEKIKKKRYTDWEPFDKNYVLNCLK